MTELKRLWIGPNVVDCEGVVPQQCLLITESHGGEFELFYDEIEGFVHVEGTSYVIDVEVIRNDEPAADESSFHYRLVEVIESSS